MRKEQEDEMECQKQFWAHPVPSHVHQALYHKMMEQREKERKHDIEQRKQFLLSIQKPFKFQEREKDKRLDLLSLNQDSQDSQDHVKKTVNVKKSFSKEGGDSPVSKLKGEFFLFAGMMVISRLGGLISFFSFMLLFAIQQHRPRAIPHPSVPNFVLLSALGRKSWNLFMRHRASSPKSFTRSPISKSCTNNSRRNFYENHKM